MFEFRMVRDLGWRSAERMRAGITEREYQEWLAFYRFEQEEADRLSRKPGRGRRG